MRSDKTPTAFRRSYQPVLEHLEARTVLSGSSPNRDYVAHLYQDLLRREADPRGLASWTARLDKGMSKHEVVRQITAGPEYRNQLIDRWFQVYLARPANADDLATLSRLPTSRQVLATILNSTEYYENRSGGHRVMFVVSLYHDLFGRRADDTARDLFAQPGTARDSVVRLLLASQERAEIEVRELYQQFFDRTVDPNGLRAFSASFRRGASHEDVIASLLSSREYIQRTATEPPIPPRVRHFGAVAEKLYEQALGRTPTPAEVRNWIDRFIATVNAGRSPGTVVFSFLNSTEALQTLVARWHLHYLEKTDTLQQVKSSPDIAASVTALDNGADFFAVLTDLLASDRFYELSGGTDEGLATNLYRKVLEREPSPEEITTWSERLAGSNRRAAIATFLNSTEANRTVAAHWFRDYLGSPLSVAQLKGDARTVRWGQWIAEYHDYSAVLAQLLTSSDYFEFPLDLYGRPQVGLAPAPGPFVQPPALQRGPQPSYRTGDPIVSTSYFYWYTVNPPGNRYLLNRDGGDGLTTHPATLEGFDYMNVAWHTKELQDMQAAGIDVVLPVYHGWPHSDQDVDPSVLPEISRWNIEFTEPGLRRMMTAHRQLRAAGATPPRVGMFYDTNTIWKNSYGFHVNLHTYAGKRWFYETIRNFFSHIPSAHWARVDGKPLVFLFRPSRSGGVDDTLADTVRGWFQRDFGVSCYIVTGNEATAPLVLKHEPVFETAARMRTEHPFNILPDLLAREESFGRANFNTSEYVRRLFDKLFDRQPNANELTHWATALGTGATRRNVIDVLLHQPEAMRTMVARWYRHYLRREESIAQLKAGDEIDGWSRSLQRGATPNQVLAGILSSEEFYRLSGNSNGALVDNLYQQVYQRFRDGFGRASWLARMNTESRRAVIHDFLNTEEARQVEASVWVWFYLGRYYIGDADSTFEWGSALHPQFRGVACIGPGYDHSAQAGRLPLFKDRENGQFYRDGWEAFLEMQGGAFIVHVETWNEFFEGTDIAESREYGRQYIELTRFYADQFHSRGRQT